MKRSLIIGSNVLDMSHIIFIGEINKEYHNGSFFNPKTTISTIKVVKFSCGEIITVNDPSSSEFEAIKKQFKEYLDGKEN